MAKGTVAKTNIVNKLKEVFGSDYIGENANKHYVWADDGGEKVQIAISLTCPKVQLESVGNGGNPHDFTTPTVVAPTTFVPAEITEEEKNNIVELMERLGL